MSLRPEDWVEATVFGLITVLLLTVALLVLIAISWFINHVGRPQLETSAIVSSKSFIPAHTQTSMLMVGKVFIPQVQMIPEAFEVCLHSEKGNDCLGVDVTTYRKVTIGDSVTMIYDIGRLNGSLNARSIKIP